jgi:hypothetical protein
MLDLKDYIKNKSLQDNQIHVFVDKNPCIHVLLTTLVWSRLFSLARIIEDGKVIVLKGDFPLCHLWSNVVTLRPVGVDGTLYHGQDVLEKFIEPNARIDRYELSRLDQETNTVVRENTRIKADVLKKGFINLLSEVQKSVITSEAGFKNDLRSKWLVNVR